MATNHKRLHIRLLQKRTVESSFDFALKSICGIKGGSFLYVDFSPNAKSPQNLEYFYYVCNQNDVEPCPRCIKKPKCHVCKQEKFRYKNQFYCPRCE